MSATVKRNRVSIWTPKELKKRLKDTTSTLKQVSSGLNPVPYNQEYVTQASTMADELLADLERFEKLYTDTIEGMSVKRTSSLKPRVCDIKLTDFLSSVYGVNLPTMDKYGICDVNILAFRAISLYLKENRLTASQFFTLDDMLLDLFTSSSVNDPDKTYLDLAKERISELSIQRGSAKKTAAAAEIIDQDGNVTMNHSALKIVVSKFTIDYELIDSDRYLGDLNELSNVLQNRIDTLSK